MQLFFNSIFIFLFFLFNHAIASEHQLSDGYNFAQKGEYLKAYKVFKPLAEGGNAWAQYSLGVMYRDGLGIQEDYELAAKWTRLSAKQGNKVAAYNLGIFYQKGQGVNKDFHKAMKWFDLASLDKKLVNDVISRVRDIRSSDLLCKSIYICKYAYRVYRRGSILSNTNSMIYLSNILIVLPEKKYLTDAIMWQLVSKQLGIKDQSLNENTQMILDSLKIDFKEHYQNALKLASECLKSDFIECGIYDEEMYNLNFKI